MVEVDPKTNKAIHKIYAMGRYMHEDAHCMPDRKTVYLSDDADPAVFFKFIAEKGYEPPEYLVDHRRAYLRWL